MIVLEVAPGVTLSLAVPAGAREEAADALPSIDVSAVPGARVASRRGFSGGGLTVRAACVIAPSDRWAPGLEELVLGRATGLATASLGATGVRWEPGPIQAMGDRFEQRVAGREGDREVAGVRHVLGFAGEDHDVVVCSVGCAGGAACGEALSATEVSGGLMGPPPPSLLVRAALFAADRPYEAAAAAALGAAALTAALLARRPRAPGRRPYF